MAAVRLTDLLVADGRLAPDAVEEVLRLAEAHGGSLATNLLESGLIDERTLQPYLEQAASLKNRVDAFGEPQPEALRLLRRDHVETYRLIPMRLQQRVLDVLTADPTNLRALDEVAFITSCRLVPNVVTEARLAEHMLRWYDVPIPDRIKTILEGNTVAARPAARGNGELDLANMATELDRPASGLAVAPTLRRSFAVDDTAPLQLLGLGPPAAGDAAAATSPVPAPAPATLDAAESGRRRYDEVAVSLTACTSPDDVPVVILPYLHAVLQRVVMFLVTPDHLRGWDARGPRLKREAVELIRVSLNKPSVFQRVLETAPSFEGLMPHDDVEEDLLIRLAGQAWPEHTLIVPVRMADGRGGHRVAAIVYGEAAGAEALARAREATTVLAELAGEALDRLGATAG